MVAVDPEAEAVVVFLLSHSIAVTVLCSSSLQQFFENMCSILNVHVGKYDIGDNMCELFAFLILFKVLSRNYL